MKYLLMLLMWSCASVAAAKLPPLHDGDIIFHVSRSSQSMAIQRATGSAWSHMGVILHRGGEPYVFEAVQTVRYTPLAKWIARGEGGHFVIKRLREAPDAAARRKLAAAAGSYAGRPYDLTFEWSDARIYCSELVWKLYERSLGVRIGELQRLREFRLDDPLVRAKMRERYGERVPLDEQVISPAAMFDSPLLQEVVSR